PRRIPQELRNSDDEPLGGGQSLARGRVPIGDVLKERFGIDRSPALPIHSDHATKMAVSNDDDGCWPSSSRVDALGAPQVPEVIVRSANEDVDPVRSPGDCRRIVQEYASDPVPVAPVRAVPPLVLKLAVCTGSEDIEPVRRPRGNRRSGRDRSTEVL